MNRGIARSGARCPSPVSSAGFSSSAHASFCWYEGRGSRAADGVGDGFPPGAGIQGGDDAVDDGDRVTPVVVRALRAPGPACPVPGGDGPVLAACGARLVVAARRARSTSPGRGAGIP